MTYDPRRWLGNSYEDNLNASTNKGESQSIDTGNKYNPQPSFYNKTDNDNGDYYNSNEPIRRVDEYDPSAPSISGLKKGGNSEVFSQERPDPRKLDFYITTLQKMITPLPYECKKMLPYDVICQLAHAILDGTVFDIAKGLRDIQKITEKNLSAKRIKLANEQKDKTVSQILIVRKSKASENLTTKETARRQEMLKRHKSEIESSQSRPHQILIYEKKHNEEVKAFNENTDKEISALDQKLVLDLDQQVSDQQATFERAGLPLFFITNKPDEIKVQMYILAFITKLSGVIQTTFTKKREEESKKFCNAVVYHEIPVFPVVQEEV